jgi:hypothetical protein
MTSLTVKETGREHELKCWPGPFGAIAIGEKGWEYRYDDRGYSVGDVLVLREWTPAQQTYTGRVQRVLVTYILHGGFGLPMGYVIMSVVPVAELRAVTSRWLDLLLTAMVSSAVAATLAAWWCAR